MITEREKFLMREAMHAAPFYSDLDQWINEVISDVGHTVEQHLDYDADRISENPIKDVFTDEQILSVSYGAKPSNKDGD